MKVTVTKHAIERAEERLGWGKQKSINHVSKVLGIFDKRYKGPPLNKIHIPCGDKHEWVVGKHRDEYVVLTLVPAKEHTRKAIFEK